MRRIFLLTLPLAAAAPLASQQIIPQASFANAPSVNTVPNLPVEKIGANDLLGITVYDAPELTRPVRVEADGAIRLPLVKERIQIAGLYPAEVENAITKELLRENVLVDPVVTVSVMEYQSRPITVAGAVKNPLTFQATGTVTLLDAISRAQGLTEVAGSEILVSESTSDADAQPTDIQRIPVRGLLDGANPSLNLTLRGGEIIRVPDAGRIFVVGDVKKPGAFYITEGAQSSVLKALALSEGLDSFSSRSGYIYRMEDVGTDRREIPVQLKKIMDRKSPDVMLMAGDILYIPNATGARASLKALEASVGVGTALGQALIIYGH